MAGLQQINEEVQPNKRYNWVKPKELLGRDQEFCLVDIEQNHFNPEGKPQYTLQILYVWEGVVQERAFTLGVTAYRELRFPLYQQHLPLHKIHLVERTFKGRDGKTITFMDLEDVPGSVDDGKCACNEYGVVDPNDPKTWTEHYRLTRTLNEYWEETAQKPMETGSMTVADLQRMVKLLGLDAA